MRFNSTLVVINDQWRNGLVVITEDGIPEAFLDIDKGAPLANVAQNANYLRGQRHHPKIVIECNEVTAARLSNPTPLQGAQNG